MQRRGLLRLVGATTAAGLAGCVGGQRDDPDDDPSDPPSEPATDFSVSGSRCGNQADHADVTVDGGTVTVEGTTWGSDGCYTGRLESVTLEGATLTVSVTAESEAEEGESCVQCITEIDYRAVVEVASTPTEVVVVHRGEPVKTATP